MCHDEVTNRRVCSPRSVLRGNNETSEGRRGSNTDTTRPPMVCDLLFFSSFYSMTTTAVVVIPAVEQASPKSPHVWTLNRRPGV